MQKKLLYIGSSWAARSYDTVEGSETEYTNLHRELGLDAENLSRIGLSNMECLDKINNYQDRYDGILWVYCEPIFDTLHENKRSLIESENFWQLRSEWNTETLKMLNDIGRPIGLIGGPSDIFDCDYPNLTVIHPSWQKFLAEHVDVTLEHGWSAEIAHRWAMYEFPHCKPSRNMIDYTSATLNAWTQIELQGVFRGVHPNRKGNELFAAEIKNNVLSFINNI